MAGHSKWASIKRQKGANDAKRGQIFTKLGNAIAVAAKNGKDPELNPKLALAIDKAKAANMPNANIEKAIKRGSGELGGDQIEELAYEGYGPEGVAIIVEAATDNRNRTGSEVRAAFTKNGGKLADAGSVAYQFSQKGVIRVENTEDNLMMALDAGAEDVEEEGKELVVYTDMKDLHKVRQALADKTKILDAELQYVPGNTVDITDKSNAQKVIKLMDAIEDIDEVTNTYSNFDIPPEVMEEL